MQPAAVTLVQDSDRGLTAGASPKGLVFDAHGNLWVANDGVSTVVAYTPGQFVAGGAQVPNTTITLPMGAALRGMAFDNRGTLWVANSAARVATNRS